MKRVLVITLAMVLCLGAVAGATGGTKGGKDIKLTPIEGNAGLVTLNISDVVYIGFEQAQGEGQGFTQDEIDSGEAVFENIHKLKISSTVNYLVAANLLNDTEPIGFSDVVLQSMVPGSGSNIQWGVESANPDANRYVSDNLVYARARVASAAYDDGRLTCEEDWWQINGNCGDSYPDQPISRLDQPGKTHTGRSVKVAPPRAFPQETRCGSTSSLIWRQQRRPAYHCLQADTRSESITWSWRSTTRWQASRDRNTGSESVSVCLPAS